MQPDLMVSNKISSPKRQFALRKSFGKLITLSQVVVDILTVLLAYFLSYSFYTQTLGNWSPQSPVEFLIFSSVLSLVYIFLLEREGLYQREISLLNIKELRGIFHVGIYAAALVLSASFYIRSISFSRITLTLAMIASPIFLYLQRQVFYQIHLLFHQRGLSQRKILVYGAGNIGKHIAKRLFQSPSLGYLPVGFLDDDVSKKDQILQWKGVGPKNGLKVLGSEENLLSLIQSHQIELVVIALPSATFDRNQKLVERCVQLGVSYAIVPNAYEQFIQGIEMFEIGGIPLLRRKNRGEALSYLAVKRILDFVISVFFIFILSPLVFIVGFLIAMESSGPVLFKQKRIGLRGKPFSIYKFRSMFVQAPKYERTPADPNDPRITRVGRWLRRTSLDELPQLFNVLRGDMSLVGPRPEMPFIVEQYGPLERQRLEAKPGITGVWQISAVRGEPIHSNIEYDLFYLENRSVLLDLAIIIKTILSVIRGIGAI